MTSTEDWERRYAELLQRGDPDPNAAANKLELGRHNLVGARRDLAAEDADSALIHAEKAIVNAADAVLARDGYRLRGKTGSHEARFDYPGLPAEFFDRRRQLLTARRLRGQAMYDVYGIVSLEQAEAMLDTAGRLVAVAERSLK